MKINGESLFKHDNFRFALFERRGGQAPEPGDLDQLYRLGQLLVRMHAVGSSKPFKHRPELNVATYGHASFERLRTGEHVPKSLRPAWESVVDRKSTRLNSSHVRISYAVFCLKKKI